MKAVDVLTLGETMAAFRSPRALRLGGSLELTVAGAESNVAIGLSRLGHTARWVSFLGDDELGALVLRVLRAEGVLVDGVTVVPGAETGLALFDNGALGRRRVAYRRRGSAAASLGPHALNSALAAGARALHVTGITCALGEGPAAAVAFALQHARRSGWLTCLDVNFRALLWSSDAAAKVLRPLLPTVDVLVASEHELPLVADGANEDARVRALLSIVDRVVVKRGNLGATLANSDSRLDLPAIPVRERDAVGAGDAFTAGLLSGWLDGLDNQGLMQRACALGACAAAADGDWEGLPDRSALQMLADKDMEPLR